MKKSYTLQFVKFEWQVGLLINSKPELAEEIIAITACLDCTGPKPLVCDE